jgi:hypothetical protein
MNKIEKLIIPILGPDIEPDEDVSNSLEEKEGDNGKHGKKGK